MNHSEWQPEEDKPGYFMLKEPEGNEVAKAYPSKTGQAEEYGYTLMTRDYGGKWETKKENYNLVLNAAFERGQFHLGRFMEQKQQLEQAQIREMELQGKGHAENSGPAQTQAAVAHEGQDVGHER